jgi:hypothetical protein
MVDLAVKAGVQRIVLNGSFVTNIIEPNDVDCVRLIGGPGYPSDPTAEGELEEGLPFLDIALVGQKDVDWFVGRLYASDRQGEPKGMIEVDV